MTVELHHILLTSSETEKVLCPKLNASGCHRRILQKGPDEWVGVAMELLNIEIDQESQWEAVYHVLLLPTSVTIWPIVHPE